jgi:hypothetical protein
MVHHHKYSVQDIENMYPFERDIFIELYNRFAKDSQKSNSSAAVDAYNMLLAEQRANKK